MSLDLDLFYNLNLNLHNTVPYRTAYTRIHNIGHVNVFNVVYELEYIVLYRILGSYYKISIFD